MAWRHRDTSAKEWEPSMPYYTIGIYRVCIFSYVVRTRGNVEMVSKLVCIIRSALASSPGHP